MSFTFAPSNAAITIEAFDRCGFRPTELDRHQILSARQSIDLEILEWSNIGFNAWKLTSGTINLVETPVTAVYTLPTSLVTLTDLYYTQVDGYGTGQNSDRIMVPITRTQYAMIPNKMTPGIPSQYWFQMLAAPQITIWPPPLQGAPTYVLSWYGLQQIADANLGSAATPDVVYRALEALCAKLAVRLWEKFGGDKVGGNMGAWQAKMASLEQRADRAFTNMETRDQEPGPTLIQPNIAAYASMRR